jgi:hypothetical protein
MLYAPSGDNDNHENSAYYKAYAEKLENKREHLLNIPGSKEEIQRIDRILADTNHVGVHAHKYIIKDPTRSLKSHSNAKEWLDKNPNTTE